MIKSLLFAIGAVAQYLHGRMLHETLRSVLHCEEKEIAIHDQINEFTNRKEFNRTNPAHVEHLNALHRWLQQWQERKASFDERLQREQR